MVTSEETFNDLIAAAAVGSSIAITVLREEGANTVWLHPLAHPDDFFLDGVLVRWK